MKRHSLVNPTSVSIIKLFKPLVSTQWKLCIFCQTKTDETLQCPSGLLKITVGSDYKSLADNLHQFKDLGFIPMNLNLNRLDESSSIQETMLNHHAQWHKTC